MIYGGFGDPKLGFITYLYKHQMICAMKLLQNLKKQFSPTKPQLDKVDASQEATAPKTMITRTFTKDEDTFMFI